MSTEADRARLEELERHAIEGINDLQRQFELAAKPYVEILMRLRSLRPAPAMIVSLEEFEAMQKSFRASTNPNKEAPTP